MALKSTNRKHIVKAQKLKMLRYRAGYDQSELASRLGVSREKISRIENCHRTDMENLKDDQVETWFKVCSPRIDSETRDDWVKFILGAFGIYK